MRSLISVRPNQGALVIRDERTWRWLEAGRHTIWHPFAALEVVNFNLDLGYATLTPELECVLPESVERLTVPAGHLACIRIAGKASTVLQAGRYALWSQRHQVDAVLVDLEPVHPPVPRDFWPLVPIGLARVFLVDPGHRGLLYVDGELEEVLEPGRYFLSVAERLVILTSVEMRERELQIAGQEVMTADKVTLRINLALKYRVVDAQASVEGVDNLYNALYLEAQLVARRAIASTSIDALLEARNAIGAQMAEALSGRCAGWGCEVCALDLKDLILPGEMKTILNRVIEAEKQAAANLITRREETAATRSMANTAKVLDANPTLYRLKELEAFKEIAERIDNVTLVAGSELMGRLQLGGGRG